MAPWHIFTYLKIWIYNQPQIYNLPQIYPSIHPLGPYSVQSVGAAKAVSCAVQHNPGRVATPTQTN